MQRQVDVMVPGRLHPEQGHIYHVRNPGDRMPVPCHPRTQVQTWLRLAGQHVPTIYGPSGDAKWDEADPTYSLDAARRGAG